jgi:hypothetical protein
MEDKYYGLYWTDDNGFSHVMRGTLHDLEDAIDDLDYMGWESRLEAFGGEDE